MTTTSSSFARASGAIGLLALAALQPALAQAQASRAQARVQAEAMCREAVSAKAGNSRFESVNVTDRSGEWNVTGRLAGQRGRSGFQCVVREGQVVNLSVDKSGDGDRDRDRGDRDRRVKCESDDRKRNHCEMETRRGVELVEQISETRCRQGRNWGYDRRGVWVDDGCSGRFRSR